MKSVNLTTILLIGIAVLVTLQLNSCFGKTPKSEAMIRREVELELLKEQLPEIKAELVTINAKYDSLLSASQNRVQQIEDKKTPIRNAIKTDRVAVDNFDKEQLRRAVSSH